MGGYIGLWKMLIWLFDEFPKRNCMAYFLLNIFGLSQNTLLDTPTRLRNHHEVYQGQIRNAFKLYLSSFISIFVQPCLGNAKWSYSKQPNHFIFRG